MDRNWTDEQKGAGVRYGVVAGVVELVFGCLGIIGGSCRSRGAVVAFMVASILGSCLVYPALLACSLIAFLLPCSRWGITG